MKGSREPPLLLACASEEPPGRALQLCLSAAVVERSDQGAQGRMGFFQLALPGHSSSLGYVSTKSQVGIKQRPQRNAAYWLVPWLVLTWLSSTAQGHLPRDDTMI